MNFYLYNQNKDLARKNDGLLAEQRSLYVHRDFQQTRMVEMEKYMNMMSDSSMIKISLPGVQGKEQNLATLFWDKNTKDVYVMPAKLAPAPANKQYQLWALVDGVPVDAGVISCAADLCKLKAIPRAQAFAITLEEAGGSPTPNLDQLYVMGKVS
ncbi:MAG: anti-sigma factor [Chryseobacterium sp.]|nr:MAG: anti-sigma factor [Chryseobacterium sp.]